MKKIKLSRRRFLGRAATAAAAMVGFTIIPRRVLGGKGYTPPSEELTKAIVGVGAMGQNHLHLGGTRLLAVCDVDEKHLQQTLEVAGKDVKGYRDFREVLDRPDIDIIHIVTPPHWHALISIAAAQAGKDIWCEKPMTRTIGEGEKVVEAIQRHKRIFRVNTWYRFEKEFFRFGSTVASIKKVVDSGILGWPLKVTINTANGFDWKFQHCGERNLVPEPVPPELDYDFWLGPAPYKPYNPNRVHKKFRGYWDYDGGGLGDMGQHYLDPVQYFLGKDGTSPVEIEVDTYPQDPDAVLPWWRIEMKYADGCRIILDGESRDRGAAYLEGPEGKLYRCLESNIPNLREKVQSLADPEPQQTDFIEAVRTRKKFILNEENAHRSCSLVNLDKIALRTGRNLRFDPERQRFVGDEDANRFIFQPMRPPWHL